MNEVITVGSKKYTVTDVNTGLNTISFYLSGLTVDEVRAVFETVDSLSIGSDEETIYGEYPDVEFESITIGVGGDLTVTMHIPTKIERQIRELQASQAEMQISVAEHDEVIAQLLYGGGET